MRNLPYCSIDYDELIFSINHDFPLSIFTLESLHTDVFTLNRKDRSDIRENFFSSTFLTTTTTTRRRRDVYSDAIQEALKSNFYVSIKFIAFSCPLKPLFFYLMVHESGYAESKLMLSERMMRRNLTSIIIINMLHFMYVLCCVHFNVNVSTSPSYFNIIR